MECIMQYVTMYAAAKESQGTNFAECTTGTRTNVQYTGTLHDRCMALLVVLVSQQLGTAGVTRHVSGLLVPNATGHKSTTNTSTPVGIMVTVAHNQTYSNKRWRGDATRCNC
jgi:hypothetical protein